MSGGSVLVLGVGAFTHGMMSILGGAGCRVEGYLTRDYGHYGPALAGRVHDHRVQADPVALFRGGFPDLVIPMSIEWALRPWADRLVSSGVPFLCPTGAALGLERDRDLARVLCGRYGIPFPDSIRVGTRGEAEQFVRSRGRGYVIKNPLCAPTSPIHTVVCETAEETLEWLKGLDDSEGVFLQEYLGRREAGHIAMVSGGEVYSLVTNQEYKRAFDGNQGIVAGAPLGGLVEVDVDDRHGLARELLHPLRPWFRETGFRGPVQVTAMRHEGRWHVLEYNVRLGVTSGVMIARMLSNPFEVFRTVACGGRPDVVFRPGLTHGCSVTIAAYGYPYVMLTGPRVPIQVQGGFDCDVWWNEVAIREDGRMVSTGHRVADVCAVGGSVALAVERAYVNVGRIRLAGGYHRTDVGRSLWPPGEE